MITITKPFVVLYIVFSVVSILYICLYIYFLRILRHGHANLWEQLGRPTPIRNNSIDNTIAVLRFLKSRAYLDTKDTEFIVLCRVLWISGLIGILLFLVCSLLAFFGNYIPS